MIFPATVDLLGLGLQAAALRQEVLAHNVANAGTPGFKRGWVEFEGELRRALAAVAEGREPPPVRAVVGRDSVHSGRMDGNNVDVELEMARLSANQLWHAAMARQLTDQFDRLRLAFAEGRR